MDHLKSSAERRGRWYCRRIWPRYLPVREALRWRDLLELPPTSSSSSRRGEPPSFMYDFLYSCPYAWLQQERKQQDDDDKQKQDGDDRPSDLLRQALDVHGFVVVSNVLSKDECSLALDLAWDWVEAASAAERHVRKLEIRRGGTSKEQQLTVVDRNNPDTHCRGKDSVCFPRTVEGGLMPFYGSGHSKFAWNIRSHPSVIRVFEELHGTHNLLSSLDGFVLWWVNQFGVGQKNPSEDAGWFHVDQNPKCKPDASSIQGLVNLLDVTPCTGGNALVVQSHKEFSNGHYCEKVGSSSDSVDATVRDFYRQRLDEVGDDDWLELDPNDAVLLQPRRVVSLLLRAGDVLLWDSRTAHCSYPPQIGETPPAETSTIRNSKGFLRAATLVSMISVEGGRNGGVNQEVLKARKQAVASGRTLTHWVSKVAPLGEERPVDVALEVACIEFMKKTGCLLDWVDLTARQRRLVVGEGKQD